MTLKYKIMTPKYKIRITWLAVLACAILLPACSIINTPEPLKIIVLGGLESNSPACERSLPVQIIVTSPSSSAGLETDRIAILQGGRELTYLSTYKWDDTVTLTVQRQFVDALNSSACYTGAGSGSMALSAAYRLDLEVKRLHFVYVGNQKEPVAEVKIMSRLVDVRSGVMLGQFEVSTQEASTPDTLFAAMDEALNRAVNQSSDWIYSVIEKHYSGK